MVKKARLANTLAPGIESLAADEGLNQTSYAGAVVYRILTPEVPTPTFYGGSLILVGAGEKQATLGSQTFVYNADHYLMVTSPLPMICRTIASDVRPVLSLVVEIDLAMLLELLLEVDGGRGRAAIGTFKPVFRAALPSALEEAGARFLASLADERRARALAKQTVREMLFLVLEGPYGDSLRALAQGPVGQLAHILRFMSIQYAERLNVGQLADMAHMSIPTFHQHFKAITATSPLQYLKSLRLTRARLLLRAGGLVKSVAHSVGYESESQFSREYHRFFGFPPSQDGFRPDARPPARNRASRMQLPPVAS